MEIAVCHKGKGQGGRPPSYKGRDQVLALTKYLLSPAKKSKGVERVAMVIDGLHGVDDISACKEMPIAQAQNIVQQICDDVPGGRRIIRHVILSIVGKESIREQLTAVPEIVKAYTRHHAKDRRFIAVVHDDHFGELDKKQKITDSTTRGLHIHLLIRNSDVKGCALDWKPEQLRSQQSAKWCSHLGIESSRGRGIKSLPGQSVYTKTRKPLDADIIGRMNDDQIENAVRSGDITVGRRAKAGNITSIRFKGRNIRLATIRRSQLVASGAAGRKPDGNFAGVDKFRDMERVKQANRPANAKRRADFAFPEKFGFRWGKNLVRLRQRRTKRTLGGVRSATRGLVRGAGLALGELDRLGRSL